MYHCEFQPTTESPIFNPFLQLLWQCGDRLYNAKKWSDAAEWFRIGNHPALKGMGPSTGSKCMRKAALCHVQQREYAMAASDIRHCTSNEAATCYVTLLVAVYQGRANL